MSIKSQVRGWLSPIYLPWPSPALSGMRLAPETTTHNPLMIQFFTWACLHPTLSWWAHFEQELPRLAMLGVTQVWLPPMHKAMRKQGQGYDAYDLWDLGEFDQKEGIATRWGTREELLSACGAAKKHGIDIIIDAVLNHKIGADRAETFQAVSVDPKNRLKDLGRPHMIEGWTMFDFPGRNGKYSSFRWNYKHFTGVDYDARTRKTGVFRIHGKSWARHVSRELGNYDYLLGVDIDHRHPDVRKDLLSWGEWILQVQMVWSYSVNHQYLKQRNCNWYQTTGAEGFRLDAIKHIDTPFLMDFLRYTRSASRKKNMFSVAEYWSADVRLILPYIRIFGGATSFWDVPLHDNFHQASKRGPENYDLRRIFDNTIVKIRPGDAATFVDNHDTVVGQSLESWVDSNFKLQAYALILMRQAGHPCVFYGDLYPNDEGYDARVATVLARMMEARKLFAYGHQEDFFERSNVIAWTRAGDAQRKGCIVVVCSCAQKKETIQVSAKFLEVGKPVQDFLNNDTTPITALASGTVNLPITPGVQIWIQDVDNFVTSLAGKLD